MTLRSGIDRGTERIGASVVDALPSTPTEAVERAPDAESLPVDGDAVRTALRDAPVLGGNEEGESP